MDILEKFIKNETTLFKGLNDRALLSIIKKLIQKEIKSGQILINQGEMGDNLYVVYEGKFDVIKNSGSLENKIGEVNRGECIGEGALLTFEPRNATVKAISSSIVYALSYNDFQEILRQNPEEFRSFMRLVGKRSKSIQPGQFRPSSEYLARYLGSLEMISTLDSETIAQLVPAIEWVFLPGGEVLMNQGEEGKSMYMVINGRLKYIVEAADKSILSHGEFIPGDIIGEMALLTGETRSATVYSVRACELARLSKSTFEKMVLTNPGLMFGITKQIIKRFKDLQNGVRNKRRSSIQIATLFPLHSRTLEESFIQYFVNSFQKTGKKVFLGTRDKFLQQLELSNIRDAKGFHSNYTVADIASWLYEIEGKDTIVLLLVDHNDSLWSSAITQHTDRILLIADSSNEHTPSPEEIRLTGGMDERYSPKRDIVVVHKNGNKPRDSDKWRNQRDITFIFHIREFNNEDYDRVSRHLSGKSIGLALAGGGAKGLAHIGLIRAFREDGIPVDVVGGTSAGAIAAAIIAEDLDPETTYRTTTKVLNGKEAISDYYWPTLSLMSGKSFTTIFKNYFKDKKIEDLYMRYFAVATDLTYKCKKVIDRGSVWKAARASGSLPGIFPPLYDNGSLLVDGALLDNVPGSVLADFETGYTIAVNLEVSDGKQTDDICNDLFTKKGTGIAPSRFGQWSKLKKEKKLQGVTLGGIIMRSTMVSSAAMIDKTKNNVDLFIEIPIDGYGIFSFDEAENIIAAGYEYSKKHTKVWKSKLGL